MLTLYSKNLPDMVSDFFNTEWPMSGYKYINNTAPSVNIKENKENFEIELAAPGLKKEDFNVNVDNDLLTISSEKEYSDENEDEKVLRKEFSYCSFKRSFTLPDSVDSQSVSAKYDNGILYINVPKREEARVKPPKSISIS